MRELEKDMKPRLMGETWRKYPTETSTQKTTYGLFECQYCEKEFETNIQSVKCGDTKSCGCQKNKQKITHGRSNSRFYKTWYNMLQRCTNTMIQDYKDYGARGITVCEEWLDVSNFAAWAEATYPNIEDATLDRIDNDKGYSPENCRWSDKTTQAINQRMKKNNKSGYVGVMWHIRDKRWVVSIRISKKLINLGSFKDKIEAVLARDNYIIENKLPYKLSGLIKHKG